MPGFSDDLYLGPVVRGGALSAGPSPMDRGIGPMGRIYVFDVVPVAAVANGLALAQTPAAAGNLVLTAGAGVTSRARADGTTELVLDTPRCLVVTASGANTATVVAYGYDQYGQAMSFSFGAPASGAVASTKAFKSVTRVSVSAAATGTLAVGFNDKLGLPVRVTDAGYMTPKWAGALAADAGTFVAADQTSPATAVTTDVRGCYTPSSAADGAKRLVVAIAVPAIGCGPNATRVGALGVDQA